MIVDDDDGGADLVIRFGDDGDDNVGDEGW